jgi:hypothetical protein
MSELKEYEGTWEEILTHSDELAGQTVRVTVVEPEKELPLANQRMLALLDEWEKNPLPPEEMKILDDFEQFRKEHPFRLHRIEDLAFIEDAP